MSFKPGTVANITTPRGTFRAIHDSTGYWCLETGIKIARNAPAIRKVEPLTVLDTRKFDLSSMLSDLTEVRDKLRSLKSVASAWWPMPSPGTSHGTDIWATVCDLVEAFTDITKEAEPEKPSVPEPGIGGIVKVDGDTFSHGVDGAWRDEEGVPLTWDEVTNGAMNVETISNGVKLT